MTFCLLQFSSAISGQSIPLAHQDRRRNALGLAEWCFLLSEQKIVFKIIKKMFQKKQSSDCYKFINGCLALLLYSHAQVKVESNERHTNRISDDLISM